MVAGIVALGRTTVALADGEQGHVGNTGIPVIVVWIGGGVLGGLLLFIFIARFFFKQTGKPSQGGEGERDRNSRRAEDNKG